MVDQPRGTRQIYNMDIPDSSYERTALTVQPIIKEKDIKINIYDRKDETVINHRFRRVLQKIPSNQAEWSDVSRNVDFSMFFFFF